MPVVRHWNLKSQYLNSDFFCFVVQTFRAVARSPFAAICGREDHDFKTVEELCYSVRQTVYFEQSMVPQVKSPPSRIAHNPS